MDLVSIVINNYNYAEFLAEAIESALQQSYKNVEVIVVDDASTDNSKSVIQSFGSAVKAVFKQRNEGQGAAYNDGFAASRGAFIHFLDADDRLAPHAIAEVVKAWRPGVAKAHFFLRVIEGFDGIETEAVVPSGTLPEGDLLENVLQKGCYVSPPSSGNVYARQALQSFMPMPPEEWRTAADLYCIFSCVFAGSIVAINRPLGFYRVHSSNIDAPQVVSGAILRHRLRNEMKRDKLLTDLAARTNKTYLPGSIQNHVMHLKLRICSLAVDPANHPFPDDRLTSLFFKAIVKCWTDPSFSIVKRVLFTGWLISFLCSPTRFRAQTLRIGFAPLGRPKFIQRLFTLMARTASA